MYLIIKIFSFLPFLFFALKKDYKVDLKQQEWTSSFDFDGDKKKDSITYKFTGGAHCCYQITVLLTSTKKAVRIPFFINGSYMIFDLSQPNNFYIKDYNNDGLPDIFIHAYSYNGTNIKIPEKIKKRYGIKTNNVITSFKKGVLSYSNAKPN